MEHVEDALAEGIDALDVDWEPEWVPRLAVAFTTEKLHEAKRSFVAQKENDSDEVWIVGSYAFALKIFEAFDLRAFPFDVQDLNIRLRVENVSRIELAHGRSDVRVEGSGCFLPDFKPLTWAGERAGGGSLDAAAIFRLQKGDVAGASPLKFLRMWRSKTTHATLKPELHVVLLYQRNPTFYLVNFQVLLFAITSCAVTAWSVPFTDTNDRLALDVTLLLTIVAFKQVLAGSMPPISYLTRLDVFAFISFAFLVLATAMHATIGWLVEDCDADGDCTFFLGLVRAHALTIDRACLFSFLALWLVANAIYTAVTLKFMRRSKESFSLANAQAHGFEKAVVVRPAPQWYDSIYDPVGNTDVVNMAGTKTGNGSQLAADI